MKLFYHMCYIFTSIIAKSSEISAKHATFSDDYSVRFEQNEYRRVLPQVLLLVHVGFVIYSSDSRKSRANLYFSQRFSAAPST